VVVGWIETRRSGSHRVLARGDQQRIWAYHDGVDLGGPALARIARDYGYTAWVPALHINGGGSPSRAGAERDCLDDIAFALEGDRREFDSDSEALTLDVNVAPAAQTSADRRTRPLHSTGTTPLTWRLP